MPTVSYGSIGAALGALSEALAAQGSDEAAAAAQHLSAAGLYFDGVTGAIEGETAGHIIAGLVGGVLVAYALPISTVAPALMASPLIAALPPVAAGLVVAGMLAALYYYGGAPFALTYDLLTPLAEWLADILADPIVLDLDGNGIELVPLANSATMFDLDDDGIAERAGWVSPQDGFLVHDANGNGTVDGVDELFGSANVDGYDELRPLDTNGDGRINALDPAFAELRVWRDLNSDGMSTTNELQTLTEAGIASLNLGYSQINQDISGNVIARTGSYVRTDGTIRSMGSVNFALAEPIPIIPEGADLGNLITLPNLSGQLGLPDLRTAMFFDSTLRGMVENLTYGSHDFDTFAEFSEGGFLDVLYRWGGIDPSDPLEPGDAPHHIQLLAAFMGRSSEDLNSHQIERLDEIWGSFVGQLGSAFLVQAADLPALRPFFEMQGSLASLSPDDPNFPESLTSLLQGAIAASNVAAPSYEYLDYFDDLAFNTVTGEITGDFDAFVAEFIEDQPSFFTWFHGPELAVRPAGHDNRHPWTIWYEDQGSLLFAVAEAMGLGPDYVMNVTGWRWLEGDGVTDHHGTEGADLLDFSVTTYEQEHSTFDGLNLVRWTTVESTYNQRLFGFEGNDELRGNNGDDRLIGGTGDDLLKGGTGSDMYVYASGDGLDRIIDDSGADDTIYFSNELNRDALQVTRIAGTNDLHLHFGDQTQGIVLTNQWTSPGAAVDHFNFGPEGTLHAGDIATLYLATLATAGSDVIAGSWASERMIGLDGDDSLSGLAGNDVIDAGNGNDTVDGGDGNDILTGGAGNDTLIGRVGDDRLVGGTGNDLLRGAAGSDTYVFNRGDGQDVVMDSMGLGNRGGFETIEFGPGIAPGDITVVQVGYDLILKINGTADQITLDDTMDNDGNHERIEQVRFADGTIWYHVDLLNQAMLNNGGNDTFYGGPEADTLTGGAGDDTLIGVNGNDRLVGGTGNDLLRGAAGSDTYVFNRGDGQDIVMDSMGLSHRGGTETIEFGPDIAPSDIAVVQVGYDLILKINGSTDQITLDDTMDNDGNYERIEQVRFFDGTIWTHTDLLNLAMLNNGGNDSFYGGPENDTLTGGAGDDTLTGVNGDDRLIGGTGNDLLRGAAGSDTYVFNRGDGQDVVRDSMGLSHRGGLDTIEFGPDITTGDITVVQSGYDLILKINGTTDQITLDDTMDNDGNYERIDQVRFADGTIWTHADLLNRAMLNNGGNDTFYGGPENDTLTGGTGDDTLIGVNGDDRLIGGTGNDLLRGAAGSDTYVFNRGDGQDIVMDSMGLSHRGGTETIEFGPDIAPGDITVVQVGYDLILKINGTTDQITLDDTMDNDGNYERIEQVRFADGTVWTHTDLLNQAMLNNSGNDTFYGGQEADTLTGGAGNDNLVGNAGNDVLIGGAGVDRLEGGSGADTLRFYEGDSLVGTQADTIVGFAGGSDRIDLSAIDAQLSVSGDQGFTFLGTAAFTQQEGQLRYQIEGSNRRLQGDVNGDGVADFEIILTGTGALTASDIIA